MRFLLLGGTGQVGQEFCALALPKDVEVVAPTRGELNLEDPGYDLPDLIARWTPFDIEVCRFNDRQHGIVAEFTEVIACKKH